MSFNFFDIIFIVIIFIIAMHGAAVGFIKEFFSKAALILGVFASVMFYGKLSPYLTRYIESDFVSQILAFILIFVLVYLLVSVIQRVMGSVFSGDILAGLDRALGFFFGIAEGLLLVCVVLVILYAQPWFDIGSLVSDSFFHDLLKNILAEPVNIVQDFIAIAQMTGETADIFISGGMLVV